MGSQVSLESPFTSVDILTVEILCEIPECYRLIRFSIPYFRPDCQNLDPISDPVMCCNVVLRTGLRDAPNDVCVYIFPRSQCT